MLEEQDVKLTFSHKYIKNTSTCLIILTEYLLNAGRRPQTSERARKSLHNWVGQKKKEREKGIWMAGWDLHPWEGAMKEEMFLYTGVSPHWQGDQPRQRGSFGVLEESATTGFQQPEQRETCTDGQCHHPALPSLRCVSTIVGRDWVLKLGLWRSDLGRGLGLAVRKQPEEAGVWSDHN